MVLIDTSILIGLFRRKNIAHQGTHPQHDLTSQ